ncbi:MAG: DNRLRE domain-containing protein [Candidatus Komeilibacteria bacterium]|nr:DNRLRE domain-containing protein [Candidatus Komeilibacteria bacterium]
MYYTFLLHSKKDGTLKRSLSLTGFTLIEAIIYVGIVSFILIALVNIADIVQRSRARFIISNTTNVTASRVLNMVDALVRNADGFVQTSGGTRCVFNDKLWLYFATSSVPYLPSGCMGQYASGAISVEPYLFEGATSTSPDSPRYAAEGYGFTKDSKYLYTAGSLNNGWHVSKRYLDDVLYDTGFGTNGAISTSGNFGARDIVQDGQYLYIVGGHEADSTTNQAKIEKRRITDGSLVTSFGTEGVVTSTNAKIFKRLVIDSTYLYAVGYAYNSGTSQNDWVIEKRAVSDGTLDTGFDTDGIINNGFTNGTANDVTIDTTHDWIFIVGDAGGSRTIEKRLASTGAYVMDFNSTGYRQTAGGTYNSATMDANTSTTTSATLSASADSHMKLFVPTNNYGGATTLTVGRAIDATRLNRPLITFDLSGIPANATVESADLTLTVTSGQATSEVVNVYKLLSSWSEGTGNATPNVDSSWTYRVATGSSWVAGGADNTTSDRSASSMGSTTITSTAAGTKVVIALDAATLTGWVANSSTNYGMVLIGDEGVNSNSKNLATREHATASYRPTLTVRYYFGAPSYPSVYATGTDGSDLIVEKISKADGSLNSNFGSSGKATAASATTAGYGVAVDGGYVFAVGHSSNDWYIEKRDSTTGALVAAFGPITDISNTDIPYGGVLVDEDYLYIVGSAVIAATRYQYIEKRIRGSGLLDERHGLRLVCYQDYPNRGQASSCTADPPHADVSRQDLTDPERIFVGLSDFAVTTTTLGSRDAIEAQLSLKFIGTTGLFGIATTTASTTARFRIDP